MNRFWIYSAVALDFAPTTIVVGTPRPTSSAWDGPDITATSACGTSSSIISERVIRVCSSIPFATFNIFCPAATKGLSLWEVALV